MRLGLLAGIPAQAPVCGGVNRAVGRICAERLQRRQGERIDVVAGDDHRACADGIRAAPGDRRAVAAAAFLAEGHDEVLLAASSG